MRTKWEQELWWVAIFFTLAVALDAVMDYYNFQVPHNSGFWSLHTDGWRFDAWHSSKVLKWLSIVVGMLGRRNLHWFLIVAFAAINYMVHEWLYHKVLKQ